MSQSLSPSGSEDLLTAGHTICSSTHFVPWCVLTAQDAAEPLPRPSPLSCAGVSSKPQLQKGLGTQQPWFLLLPARAGPSRAQTVPAPQVSLVSQTFGRSHQEDHYHGLGQVCSHQQASTSTIPSQAAAQYLPFPPAAGNTGPFLHQLGVFGWREALSLLTGCQWHSLSPQVSPLTLSSQTPTC